MNEHIPGESARMQAQSPRAALDSWSRTARIRSDDGELFTEDCDYVAFDGNLKGREQNQQDQVTPSRRSNQTYVLVRGSEDGWKITAFHNTRYRPLRLPSGHMLRLVLMFMRLRTAMAGRARPGS